MINFECKHCGEEMEAPSELEGGALGCPRCGKATWVSRMAESMPERRKEQKKKEKEKTENEVTLQVVLVVLVTVFVIAVMLFGYLEKRDAAERSQVWITEMTEMGKEIGASSQARVDRMIEIVEAQRRRRQPLQLQITHVHSSTCGHPPDDNTKIYSAPYYPRVGRQRRR